MNHGLPQLPIHSETFTHSTVFHSETINHLVLNLILLKRKDSHQVTTTLITATDVEEEKNYPNAVCCAHASVLSCTMLDDGKSANAKSKALHTKMRSLYSFLLVFSNFWSSPHKSESCRHTRDMLVRKFVHFICSHNPLRIFSCWMWSWFQLIKAQAELSLNSLDEGRRVCVAGLFLLLAALLSSPAFIFCFSLPPPVRSIITEIIIILSTVVSGLRKTPKVTCGPMFVFSPLNHLVRS